MPRNDYLCPKHGVRELYFQGEPPSTCEDCGARLVFVVSKRQFSLGGGMTYLTEREKDSVEMQLGVRPESADHLRRIEKEKKVVSFSKSEMYRSSSPRWTKPREIKDQLKDVLKRV